MFIFLTDCNEAVLSTLHCNNCVRYVQNQKVSLYYGAYASKYNTENEKALTELMRTLTIYEKRQITRRDELKKASAQEPMHEDHVANETQRSYKSFGLGRLLSAANSSTKGDTIGAPLAAFAARNNNIFEMSHNTAPLPLNQAKAFLTDKPLRASFSKKGVVLATIYDYVYRTKLESRLSNMNYWMFTATQETITIKKSSKFNEKVRNPQLSIPIHELIFFSFNFT